MCQKKNGHHHCLIQLPDEDIEQLFIFCWLKVVWCFVMYARQHATQNRIALIQDNLVLLHWHAGVAIYLRPTRFIFVFESLQQLNLEVDYRGLCIFVKIKPNFHKICKKSWTVVLLQIKSPFDMENFKIKIKLIAMWPSQMIGSEWIVGDFFVEDHILGFFCIKLDFPFSLFWSCRHTWLQHTIKIRRIKTVQLIWLVTIFGLENLGCVWYILFMV